MTEGGGEGTRILPAATGATGPGQIILELGLPCPPHFFYGPDLPPGEETTSDDTRKVVNQASLVPSRVSWEFPVFIETPTLHLHAVLSHLLLCCFLGTVNLESSTPPTHGELPDLWFQNPRRKGEPYSTHFIMYHQWNSLYLKNLDRKSSFS